MKQPGNDWESSGVEESRRASIHLNSHTVWPLQPLNNAFEIPCTSIIFFFFPPANPKIVFRVYQVSTVMVTNLRWQPCAAAAHKASNRFVFGLFIRGTRCNLILGARAKSVNFPPLLSSRCFYIALTSMRPPKSTRTSLRKPLRWEVKLWEDLKGHKLSMEVH